MDLIKDVVRLGYREAAAKHGTTHGKLFHGWRDLELAEIEKLKLTSKEKKDLESHEKVIKTGWATFLTVGRALMLIKRDNLYREKYETFELYCLEVWGYSKTHANRQIGAASVAEILGPKPKSTHDLKESQLRPLVDLIKKPDEIREIWKKAQQLAPADQNVTAEIVLKARETVIGKSPTSHRNAWRPSAKDLTAAHQILTEAEEALKGESMDALKHALKRLRVVLSAHRSSTSADEN